MRGERNINVESLMGEYGLGRRTATRVVALLSRKVDATGTVLAIAGEDEAFARVLLSPELLKDEWDEAWLQSHAAEAGFAEAELLRVVPGEDGWRTLALEDDLLAAGVQHDTPEPQESLELARRTSREISMHETEDLFTPEQVASLKLTALTSQDADERVEALRKLVFAPMPPAQQAGVFINVLVDSAAGPRVRREAIRSLEQIGFRQDLAEAVRGLFEEGAAVYSIQRLSALLREADKGETALVLAVILEVLGEAEDRATVDALLGFVAEAAPILVGNPEKTEQFVRVALRHMDREFAGLRAGVEAALKACAAAAPDLLSGMLGRELRRSDSPPVRAVLLSLAAGIESDPDRLAELAEGAVREILNPRLPEAQRARLRYGLVRLGEPAAHAALRLLPESESAQRVELARLLDVLCTEAPVSDDTVCDAVRALLDLLKVADTATRRTALRGTLLGDPRAGDELLAEVAYELLNLMAELGLADTFDAIQSTLQRIGPAALEPCVDYMRRFWPNDAARRAARICADIVQARPEAVTGELTEQVVDWAVRFVGDERCPGGEFVYPLAAACGYAPAGAGHFDGIVKGLLENLWRMPYCMEALEALGIMAGSPQAGAGDQEHLLELFDAILDARGRVKMGIRRETAEGAVYEFGREIEFDIRAVPAAVRGLERIYLSEQADAEMRARIVRRFLVLWEGVSKVRIVWGPAGVQSLVEAMCNAACSDYADTRTKVRLGTSLLRFLKKVSVVRSIGLICSRPDPAPEVQNLALDALDDLLREWSESDAQDDERRTALLVAAGRVAANPALDAESDDVRDVRSRALAALFSGLREGAEEVREPLLALRECEGVTERQKQDIDERLGKVFGLVRGRG